MSVQILYFFYTFPKTFYIFSTAHCTSVGVQCDLYDSPLLQELHRELQECRNKIKNLEQELNQRNNPQSEKEQNEMVKAFLKRKGHTDTKIYHTMNPQAGRKGNYSQEDIITSLTLRTIRYTNKHLSFIISTISSKIYFIQLQPKTI